MLEKKRQKLFIIISITALLITSGYVFYKQKKHDFFDHQLQDLVQKKTNKLYKINFDSISVNEVGGNLYIKNIHIKGDTTVQLQMLRNNDSNATKAIFDFYIPTFQIIHFKTARALLSKQLECKQIILLNPQVQVYLFPGRVKQKDEKKQQEELYKQVLGSLKLIKTDSVSIVNSEVTASDFFSKEVKFHTFNTTINLSDVAIDSTYNQDTTRTFFCKAIAITSDKVILGDKNNAAEIQHATFDTKSKLVALKSFAYDALESNGSFKTKIEGISLEGTHWTGPVENSELVIDKMVVEKAAIETRSKPEKINSSKEKQDKKILTGWLQKFTLNSLRVKAVHYTSRTNDLKSKPVIVKNNSILIKNIIINRASELNRKLISQAKEIELSNDEISISSSDNLYMYKVNGMKINTRFKSLRIKSFKVIPQLSEEAFARKVGFQSDRYDISIPNIICSNVNIEKLIKGEIEIESISTKNNSIKIFRDLSFPIDSISKRGQQQTYPHQIIHTVGFPLHIKSFTGSKTNVQYKEKNPASNSSGRVRFSNSNITINNISNGITKAGEKMTVRFTTTLLEKIPVSGFFTFSLDRWRKGNFTAEATVPNSFDVSVLNELTQPMSMIKLEKGVIKSVRFAVQGDTNSSKATLVLPYQDLKILLLGKKGSQYNKKGIFSLFANVLVKNNNKEDANMRTAKIVLERNKYRSFFNFIWTSIFKGIKEICILKI